MSTAPDAPVTTHAGGGSGLKLTSWDVGFLASALVVLAGSLVPLITVRWGVNLWGVYNLFFLGIGLLLPLTAAGFLLARAASGRSTRDAGPRLGSLSTEQFAHVAAWLALAFYFITFATSLDPVLLIGLAGSLGLVVTSPLRRLVAPLVAGTGGARASAHSPAQDPAHSPVPTPAPAPDAGEVRDPVGLAPADPMPADLEPAASRAADSEAEYFPSPAYGRPGSQESQGSSASPEEYRSSPAPEDPTAGAEIDEELGMTRVRPRSTDEAAASATAAFGAPAADSADTAEAPDASATAGDPEAAGAASSPAESGQPAPRGTEPADYEAFWFAVGTRRPAVDPESGTPVFELEPGGWILALEDRGHEFLVQNTDGRTGVLRDLTDIERA